MRTRRQLLVSVVVTAGLLFSAPGNLFSQQWVETPWQVVMTISGDTGKTFTLTFGTEVGATDGWDELEDELTAPPPYAGYYAYFSIPTFPNFLKTDIRATTDHQNSWYCFIQDTVGNATTSTLTWDSSTFPSGAVSGSLTLIDDNTSTALADMLVETSIQLTGGQALRIDYVAPQEADYFNISGNVTYYFTSNGVENTTMDLTGGATDSQPTDGVGYYEFTDLQNGLDYTVTPSKSGDIGNSISGADALLCLQYLAFLHDLTNDQKIAADVTTDGNVSGADALAILRYLAFFTTNIGHTGEWTFRPTNIDTNLTQNIDNLNFTAYVLGDPTGDWGTSSSAPVGRASKSPVESGIPSNEPETEVTNITLEVGEVEADGGSEVIVSITIVPHKEMTNTLIFTVEYDSLYLEYISTARTELTKDFMMIDNGTQAGKVHIAMAGVKGIGQSGEVLRMAFKVREDTKGKGSTELVFTRALVNDLEVAKLMSGQVVFAANSELPKRFKLSQNYPNPFPLGRQTDRPGNSETVIRYAIPEKVGDGVKVTLKIYNLMG